MENPTWDMILVFEKQYLNQHIYIWRGKYSKKDERLYSVGNMYFNSMAEAKNFISGLGK